MDDLLRWAVELVVAAGGGASVAYLLTLRQRKALLAAQAGDVVATGQARILDAAGRIVENQADLVPQLLERVTTLEGALAQANELRDARYDAVRVELDEVHEWAGKAVGWMGNAVRLIAELGGHVDPPPPVPTRRPFPRPAPTAAAASREGTA